MEEIKTNATEASAPTIAPEEDYESKVAELEAEKARLVEESANYKMAYLKEKSKKAENDAPESDDSEEKMRRIAMETLASSRLAEIAREQDAIIKKALRENKELKLAHSNKATIPSSTGTHNESPVVQDTLVTPEQMESFKARGWTDKDIERYKKNLRRYGAR